MRARIPIVHQQAKTVVRCHVAPGEQCGGIRRQSGATATARPQAAHHEGL
ncbi:hypothetical protein ACH3VS_11885 [Streptomyces sp. WSLK1-3]